MIKNQELVGCLLIGGKSSRMGFDKWQLEVSKNQNLYQLQSDKLKKVFTENVVVGNKNQIQYFANQSFIQDEYDSIGPISGIYTALKTLKKPLFVLAIDMPYFEVNNINEVLKNRNKLKLGCICKNPNNFLEPLCGIYEPACLPIIKKQIENKIYSLNKLIQNNDFQYVENLNKSIFLNINLPNQLTFLTKKNNAS